MKASIMVWYLDMQQYELMGVIFPSHAWLRRMMQHYELMGVYFTRMTPGNECFYRGLVFRHATVRAHGSNISFARMAQTNDAT